MKKIKKMFVVFMLCSLGAITQYTTHNTPKIYAGIAYAGNANRNQGAIITAADGVTQVCLYYALLGSGITGGASLALGLAVSA
ncbi:hypothetical protein [Prevotella sp.]|nr:hypothetical protein [Prevotella sp.]